MEAILEGLADIQKKKIGKCILARELWLKLEQYYSNKVLMKLSLMPTPQEFIDADDAEALVNVGALEVYGVLLVVDAAQGVQSAQRMFLYYDE